MRRHPRRAEVDPHNPRGWFSSDRNGHIGNLYRAKWQFEYRGSKLINTRILVHEDELDVPQRQLGTIVIPPDPLPLINARPENYAIDEEPVSTRYTIDKFGNLGGTRILMTPAGSLIPSNRIVTLTGGGSSINRFSVPLQAGLPPAVFVNNGIFTEATAASVTPPLPGSRVNGNLLVAWCRQAGTGTATLSVSAGWTLCAQDSQGASRPSVVAYSYVTGGESAPVFSSTITSIYDAVVLQFSGTDLVSPIGNVAHNSGVTTPMTCNSISASGNSSVALNICQGSGAGVPPAPAGWSSIVSSNALVSPINISTLTLASIGNNTGLISVSYANTNYTEFNIELVP